MIRHIPKAPKGGGSLRVAFVVLILIIIIIIGFAVVVILILFFLFVRFLSQEDVRNYDRTTAI